MFALCVVGAVIALVRRPTPAVMLASAIVVLAPLTSVATIDLAPRRALVLIPFLALLAGAGLSEALRVIRYRLGRVATVVAAGILAVLLAFSSYQNCSDFFHTTVHAQQVRRRSRSTCATQWSICAPFPMAIMFTYTRTDLH